MPPLMAQIEGGMRLDPAEADEPLDGLRHQRAIHARMAMPPALNVIGMRDGSETAFGARAQKPNADVIHSMGRLDLEETGPPVVAAPPNVIVKGEPFEPSEKQTGPLREAVETARRMILAMRQPGRDDGRDFHYSDRQYQNIRAGAVNDRLEERYRDIDRRAGYFRFACSSVPAMVMWTIGAGSTCPFAARLSRPATRRARS